jgi:hypothetical protein
LELRNDDHRTQDQYRQSIVGTTPGPQRFAGAWASRLLGYDDWAILGKHWSPCGQASRGVA